MYDDYTRILSFFYACFQPSSHHDVLFEKKMTQRKTVALFMVYSLSLFNIIENFMLTSKILKHFSIRCSYKLYRNIQMKWKIKQNNCLFRFILTSSWKLFIEREIIFRKLLSSLLCWIFFLKWKYLYYNRFFNSQCI